MSQPGLPPLSLYVHVPWCLKKCPYCDFNSHAVSGELPESEYINNLLADLSHDLGYVQGRSLESIFIGGGTPSLFSPDAFTALIEGIQSRIPFEDDIEITLEANPGTFEIEKFRGFRLAGINRLSIGIQSFDGGYLQMLGRVHDADEARQAAGQAMNAGFDNFNFDLMFGLPGQSASEAMSDLDIALSCSPTHLSWYRLTIEPNTVFYSKPPVLPEDDTLADIQAEGIALLAENGIERYEISAFSLAGQASKHNLNYWQFGDYLGIGAGAHGKITLPAENQIIRTRKRRQPTHYLDACGADFSADISRVSSEDLPLEFMMNALRLKAGSDEALFAQRTGIPLNNLAEPLARLRRKGLLQQDRLAATELGYRHLNSLLDEFLSP